MIAKTGLLVLTNPIHFNKILPKITKQIKNTLYIHLTSALNDPFTRYKPEKYNTPPKYSNIIYGIYSEAARLSENLDVRVLLSNLRNNSINRINTSKTIDTIIFDKLFEKPQTDHFIDNCVNNKKSDYNVLFLENSLSIDDNIDCNLNEEKNYKHAVVGGTFDRLHIGHKILLSEAILNASEKVTVGVTDANMIKGKTLWELIESCDLRVEKVNEFLNDVCAELNYSVVPIQDPFGPTKSDPSMDVIIVSAETMKGGEKVNELRKQNNLCPLDIKQIELLNCHDIDEIEESKISSSTKRIRLLGTLLKKPDNALKDRPYVIGLTGGIASGKSSVSSKLASLGATIIDCDKVAHELYKPGQPCYKLVRDAFGEKIIAENGEINRKALGAIVFADPKALNCLNLLVWPAIAEEVQNRINSLYAENKKIVVIEAAVLITAGWQKYCNEVWTCIIPPNEAMTRLQNRNKLTEKEAEERIHSQPPNSVNVEHAHVVLSTFWKPEYTQKLIEKAWKLLNQRLPWNENKEINKL